MNGRPSSEVFFGHCPICRTSTRYIAHEKWYRDYLICENCTNSSSPRERAIMHVLEGARPKWRHLKIHETSPSDRGASLVLRRECPNYIGTQFYLDVEPGLIVKDFQCENLESQTFDDSTFDIVIAQDVMEHVFRPDLAHKEIFRTLKRGGVFIQTVPIYKNLIESFRRAQKRDDGTVEFLCEPEYHGNPINSSGSLVTFHYGYDFHELVASWTLFDVEVRRFMHRTHGIFAEFTEVVLSWKPE